MPLNISKGKFDFFLNQEQCAQLGSASVVKITVLPNKLLLKLCLHGEVRVFVLRHQFTPIISASGSPRWT